MFIVRFHFCFPSALEDVFLDINSSLPTSGINAVFGGCTAVVALVRGPRVWVANAGDSRALVAGRGVDGAVVARGLTRDQARMVALSIYLVHTFPPFFIFFRRCLSTFFFSLISVVVRVFDAFFSCFFSSFFFQIICQVCPRAPDRHQLNCTSYHICLSCRYMCVAESRFSRRAGTHRGDGRLRQRPGGTGGFRACLVGQDADLGRACNGALHRRLGGEAGEPKNIGRSGIKIEIWKKLKKKK